MFRNIKDWSLRWWCTMAILNNFQDTFGMPSYWLMYRNCHLLVEIKHHTYWAIKKFNFDMLGWSRKEIIVTELEKIHNDAYKNANHIMRKSCTQRQKMLLFNSRLHLFLGKLHSWWSGHLLFVLFFYTGPLELTIQRMMSCLKWMAKEKNHIYSTSHMKIDTKINLSNPLNLD